uniref:Uncharacterized protein n=1 Tax=Rhizophora mucronata TaxID=61149 RepID=A0A2P2P884_RHIMU
MLGADKCIVVLSLLWKGSESGEEVVVR